MRNPARLTSLTSALVLLALAALVPAMASAFPSPEPGPYYQSGSLKLTFSVDPLGTVDPKTGAATIGGVLSCSEPATIDEFFGVLYQESGGQLIEGGFSVSGACSGRWSATIRSNYAATFHPGKATFGIQVEVIAGPDNGAIFPGFTGSVVLRPVKGAAG
jgi:hypothetical protein